MYFQPIFWPLYLVKLELAKQKKVSPILNGPDISLSMYLEPHLWGCGTTPSAPPITIKMGRLVL